jgi:tetratricopeptide (TPR) repeat protein
VEVYGGASSLELLRLGDLNGAENAADREVARLEGGGSSECVWRSRMVCAELRALRGDVEGSLSYLEGFSPPTNATDCARLRMLQGSYEGSLGHYRRADQLLSEAETLARYENAAELLGEIDLSRGFIFFLQKNYFASEKSYREALKVGGQAGGWYLRGHGLWGVGKTRMIRTEYEEAIPWLEESLAIFEAAGARLSIALVWGELGVCRLGLGRDEEAMELFRKAEMVNRDAGFVHNYQVVLANIGNVYLYRRDYFTALSYYRSALWLAREIKDPVSVKKWSYNINLAYARLRAAVDQRHPGHGERSAV